MIHLFLSDKWVTSKICALNFWYQWSLKAEQLQFDKHFPKPKLFWIFIPETSLRTAVFLCISLRIWVSFLGPTSSASTCQWYPRCSVKAHRCRKRKALPILVGSSWSDVSLMFGKSVNHGRMMSYGKHLLHSHVLEATLKSMTIRSNQSNGMHQSLGASVATSSLACKILQYGRWLVGCLTTGQHSSCNCRNLKLKES